MSRTGAGDDRDDAFTDSASTGEAVRVTAIGGGHGLAATLAACRTFTSAITAVVSVADDGGSTGRLREGLELPALGDLRKALVALADPESPLARAMHHRFGSGDVEGHAFGNLLIAALTQVDGNLIPALDQTLALLDGIGRVLPVIDAPVALVGESATGERVTGQVAVMGTSGITRVWTEPTDRKVPAEVLAAITSADLVLIGPGSLFTSVLAALSPDAVRVAVRDHPGRVVYLCNLRPQAPESAGMTVAAHVDALHRHGVRVDAVLYDPAELEVGLLDVPAVACRLAAASQPGHDPQLLGNHLRRLAHRAPDLVG